MSEFGGLWKHPNNPARSKSARVFESVEDGHKAEERRRTRRRRHCNADLKIQSATTTSDGPKKKKKKKLWDTPTATCSSCRQHALREIGRAGIPGGNMSNKGK